MQIIGPENLNLPPGSLDISYTDLKTEDEECPVVVPSDYKTDQVSAFFIHYKLILAAISMYGWLQIMNMKKSTMSWFRQFKFTSFRRIREEYSIFHENTTITELNSMLALTISHS